MAGCAEHGNFQPARNIKIIQHVLSISQRQYLRCSASHARQQKSAGAGRRAPLCRLSTPSR